MHLLIREYAIPKVIIALRKIKLSVYELFPYLKSFWAKS